MTAIASSFGNTLKYYIKLEAPHRPVAANAFTVLMSAQQQISTQRFLTPIENPRNKKEELNNVVLNFFEQEHLSWTPSEIATNTSENFITLRVEVCVIVVTTTGYRCKECTSTALLRSACCKEEIIYRG